MSSSAILFIDSSKGGWNSTFARGVKYRNIANKDILEETIILGGKRVRQIVVPDLFESNTAFDSQKLTDALSRGYDYQLFFIMQASNRGPSDNELIKMSKINGCIKRISGLRISFHVIVNKIEFEEVYDMYRDNLAHDNCKSLFESLEIPGFSFNIKPASVSLVRLEGEEESIKRILCEVVTEGDDVKRHPSAR